jgi:hypothetical protein
LDLGCGRELLKGFYQSAGVTDGWTIKLNINSLFHTHDLLYTHLSAVASAFYRPYDNPNILINGVCFAMDVLNKENEAPPTDLPANQVRILNKEFNGMRMSPNIVCTFLFVRSQF